MPQNVNTDQPNGTTWVTEDVLRRHLDSFSRRDLSALIADYDTQARLFTTHGVRRGPAAIGGFFAAVLEEFAKPGFSFQRLCEDIDGDTAYLVWKAETADNHYEFATDTLVVRNCKIVTQTFAAKVTPKPRSY
jgi:hypothetical protein